jgi:capsular exopolysaccharide synthesis family protein
VASNPRLPSTDVAPPAERGQLAERLPAPGPAPAYPEILDAEFTDAPRRHLRDHFRVLYKYRWLAASCFGLTVGLAVLATLLTPRVYTASTRLQVARQSPIQLRLEENVLRLDDSDRNVNGTSSFLATQVAALRSRDLADRVIRGKRLALNDAFLDPGPAREGLLTLSGRVLNLLRPRGWESAPSSAATVEESGTAPADPALIDRYMEYLKVQDVRGTDLVEVSFTTPSPSLSAFLAAAHTQAYMEANEEARIATNVTAKDFLGRQLRESREQVERAEAALSRFAADHPNVAINQEQKLVGQRIGELSSLLVKAEAARVALQTRSEFLGRPDIDPRPYFLDREGIRKLQQTLLDLRAQRVSLANRLGPNHPQMVELHRHETEVEAQLDAEVAQEVAGVRSRYAAAQLREAELRRKLAEQEEAAIGLRELGARYDFLKNDLESAHALHASLLKQQMETAVNSQLAASNIRVVERAEVPQSPSKPNVPLNLTLGILAGTVLAFGVAFLCDYFDNSVKSSEDVEGLLQLPTLATIPNFNVARRVNAARMAALNGHATLPVNGHARELVVAHEPRSAVAEAFRSLRTAVLFSAAGAPPRVILVTSAGAGEGKTINSLNLATTLADAGSRVILLDVDLRRPGCHHVLGIDNECGLSSFLAGQAELDAVVHALDAPRLDFVPAGPTPPNPAELVGSARMREALERLQEEYDFVILDSPPVLPVTDASVLAREADGVVLVVKGHDTPRELVRRARDQLQQAGARLLGVVVNNVDLGWGDLYLYNRYYGAYYGAAAEAGEEPV